MLSSKYQIVNSKSASFPIVYPPLARRLLGGSFWRAHQTAHPANPTRSVLNTKSEIVNRKLDKPAHKAAISPGPPIPPRPTVLCPLPSVLHPLSSYPPTNKTPPEGPPQFCNLHFDLCIFLYTCRESSTNRPLFVQTNPILSASGGFKTPYLAKGYENERLPARPKTNPKRTQTNPKRTQFLARQGPPNPKQTQANPKQTQSPKNPKINATSFMEKGYDNGTAFGPKKTNPNKPNFLMPNKMNANFLSTKAYENESTFSLRKNEPNRSQFQRQKKR